MQKPSLNQRTATSLPPQPTGQRTYFDAKLPGFGLRVSASGHRSWVAVYRLHGRKRRYTLGPIETLTAEAARTQAFEILARARRGEDPAAEKQAQRRAETFAELADLYLARHATKKRDGGARDRAILEREFRQWRHLPAASIRRRDVLRVLDAIKDRGAGVAANRALACIRKVFAFGVEREMVEVNPAAKIRRPTDEHSRERVLKDAELKALWEATEPEDRETRALVRLLLLTGQRTGETKAMRWADVDQEEALWTIPATVSKNGKEHAVPLSPAVTAILADLRAHATCAPCAFPSDSGSGHRASIQKAIRRLRKASGVTDWTPHDARRTVATAMGDLGVARETIRRVLNHQERDVTATYERSKHLREMRQALEAWARRLHAIVTGEASAKVIPLVRA